MMNFIIKLLLIILLLLMINMLSREEGFSVNIKQAIHKIQSEIKDIGKDMGVKE